MTRDSDSRGTSNRSEVNSATLGNQEGANHRQSGVPRETSAFCTSYPPGFAQLALLQRHSLPTGVTARYSQRIWLSYCVDILQETMSYKNYALNLRNARASHVGRQARAASGSPAAAAIHLEVSVPASTLHRRPSSRA